MSSDLISNLCTQPNGAGCIVCCPAVCLAAQLPLWRPATNWPRSRCGPWRRRSAAASDRGSPDTVQKLCAPAGLPHTNRGPAMPKTTPKVRTSTITKWVQWHVESPTGMRLCKKKEKKKKKNISPKWHKTSELPSCMRSRQMSKVRRITDVRTE